MRLPYKDSQANYVGGIPRRVFAGEMFNSTINSRNGDRLYCCVSPQEVLIQSNSERNIWFKAKVHTGIMDLHVNTKGFHGEETEAHPDFEVKKLVKETLRYFKKFDTNIKTIKVYLDRSPYKDSKNQGYVDDDYSLFYQVMDGINSTQPDQDTLKYAAQNTNIATIMSNEKFIIEQVAGYSDDYNEPLIIFFTKVGSSTAI